MIVEERPSGLMVPVSPAKKEPPKKKQRHYFSDHYGDIGCIMRMLEEIKKNEAELVSIVRHGSTHGIQIEGNKIGYVITYFGEKQLGTWEKT